jgi:hypothetical protein
MTGIDPMKLAAKRGRQIVAQFAHDPFDRSYEVADLIADLGHYLHSVDADFDADDLATVCERAVSYFAEELRGDR